jgi:phthalate 4,5-dioxygenase reductase component
MVAAAEPDMRLRIARKEEIARDIHLFELRRTDGGDLPEFTAGAHVAVRVPNGVLRKYAVANDPAARDRYVTAVRREAAGRGGSISLVDDSKVGDELMVSAPVNDFELARNAQNFIFIAAGIGIVPFMSMIHELRRTPGKQFKLYYCARAPEDAAFREELSAPELTRSVTIHYDGGDPARALDIWPIVEERKNRAHLYCCGPRPLLESVRDMTGHWSSSAVHLQAFEEPERRKPDDKPFRVRLARSDETFVVPGGVTILEALRAAGHDAPSSCESGTCGTCRTKLIAGEADHRDLVLAEHERASQIMICVSRARSDELVLDR